ncbi:MAG: hypothetical protein K6F53_10510 [Lachnospiraceae bacterium]|nr:hypothetical protein [Lachnospiraceae bacterium]
MARFNEYEFNKLRAKRHAEKVKQRQELYKIRHSNDGEKKKPAFSKLAIFYIFINATAIQIFCMWAMVHFEDISNLGSLIGILGTLLAEGISYSFYSKKAQAENTVGGMVYQNMIYEHRQNAVEDANDIVAIDAKEGDTDDAVG